MSRLCGLLGPVLEKSRESGRSADGVGRRKRAIKSPSGTEEHTVRNLAEDRGHCYVRRRSLSVAPTELGLAAPVVPQLPLWAFFFAASRFR